MPKRLLVLQGYWGTQGRVSIARVLFLTIRKHRIRIEAVLAIYFILINGFDDIISVVRYLVLMIQPERGKMSSVCAFCRLEDDWVGIEDFLDHGIVKEKV